MSAIAMANPSLSGNTRKGRGKSQKNIDMIAAAHEILQEIQPATVRAVCYRLFIAGVIPSMEKKNTQRVSEQLVYARENKIIPWRWIVDETREAERPGTWDEPEIIINAAVRQYRRNNWQDQDAWVEVWSEKGTVRGTLAPVLREYGITLRVMHGFSSATVINQIAEETSEDGRTLNALYVGDHDPSGKFMSEADLPDRCRRYGADINIKRIALLSTDTRDLPDFDAKSSDKRFDWYRSRYGLRAWELDAMSPPVLRDRVKGAIQSFINMDVWNRSLEVEMAEIESMQSVLSRWKSLSDESLKFGGSDGSKA